MKRKNLRRSNSQYRASEVNQHITQSSFASRQPWSLLLDLAFMPTGREMTSCSLHLTVGRLDCLPPALILQKEEKIDKME